MCGRYALALRPADVRRQLQRSGMPVDEAPDDDDTRQSYNVAPGYYEPVYRAIVPDWGAGPSHHDRRASGAEEGSREAEAEDNQAPQDDQHERSENGSKETKYKLQAMKWGLIPFWTKRNPDYGSMLKTINCRDDSLKENRGMWNTMKQRKRCIVVCQGFYEWLKKAGGKEKIPHFVKRKDGELMCFAGLWDCVQYEGSEEKIYTYTIITTDSNDQLKFLHDRMPVILENGSEEIRTWLDPNRYTWSAELQSLLKPFKGELEVYPVSKDVGKVGNNSPAFIVPLSSSDNKQNIANFFGNAKGGATDKGKKQTAIKKEEVDSPGDALKVEHQPGEDRKTIKEEDGTEDNAPVPVPAEHPEDMKTGKKRKLDDEDKDKNDKPEEADDSPEEPKSKVTKREASEPAESKPQAGPKTTPKSRKTRSATSNESGRVLRSSPRKTDASGSQKITGFFKR